MSNTVYYINTNIVAKYREFNRESNPFPIWLGLPLKDVKSLENDIKINGIVNPLEIMVYKGKTLLVEGNHRLSIALKLKFKKVPIKFTTPTSDYDLNYFQERKEKYVKLDNDLIKILEVL